MKDKTIEIKAGVVGWIVGVSVALYLTSIAFRNVADFIVECDRYPM